MKKTFILGTAAVAALALSLSATASFAQQQTPGGKKAAGAGKAQKGAKRQGVGIGPKMIGQLDLTEKQKADLKAIQDKARTQAQAIRTNNSLTEEQKREKVGEIMKATRAKIEGVLTPEQEAKLAKMRKDMAAKRKQDGGKVAGKAGKAAKTGKPAGTTGSGAPNRGV